MRTLAPSGERERPTSGPERIRAEPQRVHPLLQVQQNVGNQALQRMLTAPHPHPILSATKHSPRQEKAAEPANCEKTEPCLTCRAQGEARPCHGMKCAATKKPLQGVEAGGGGEPDELPSIVDEALRLTGRPLDAATRAFMEPRFCQNFSDVRVHFDDKAAHSASAVDARAYTIGRHIVFGAARYEPLVPAGRLLLAHELTHVVQQQRWEVPNRQNATVRADRHIAGEHSPAEREADALAHRVLAGESVAGRTFAAPSGRLHRSVRINPTDAAAALFLDALTRLTGRLATAAGGALALGASVQGGTPSGTVADYVQRAISATRAYTLQSGTTTPGGSQVRGVRSEATSSGVTITVNAADIGTFTWTADELVAEGFVNAVSANDRTAQTFPSNTKAGSKAGMNLDELLATTLPFTDPARQTIAMNLIRQRVPAVVANPSLEIDVEAALRGASGITLAEILRGLETNSPFRIVQDLNGDRVRATYFDPRSTPGPGQPQTLPRRGVTFLAGPGRSSPAAAPLRPADLPGMSAADVQQVNASCTPALGEIRAHVATAQNLISRTVARLDSAENLDAPLQQNFGNTGVANRARIAANLRVILSEMDFSRHSWICTPRGTGQGCNTAGVTGRTGIALPTIQLCIETGAPFIPRATTVLHEMVHAAGIGTLAAGVEQYAWQKSYPGNDPLHNADSYAQFAAAIGTGPVQTAPASTPTPVMTPSSVPPSSPHSLKRSPGGGTQSLHHEIAEEYRRSHGLPAGGTDQFGRVGPSDAEIVYGALFPVPLSELAAMSAWQLAHVPPDRLVPPAGTITPAAEPSYTDYMRAREVARFLHSFFGLTYDYESDHSVKGREPDARELQILDRNLNQLLSTFNVRTLVSGRGGRGLPTAPGGATVSLAGRVRLVTSVGDFAGKRYQLERWAGADKTINMPAAELERLMRALWADPASGITPEAGARLTNPEKVAAAWAQLASFVTLEPAFYFPLEDRFYLSPGVNLSTLEGQDTARHETVHLLGGGERTRQAFIKMFGTNWLKYWKPFEEGMAEFVNVSGRTPAQIPPSSAGQGSILSGYGGFYTLVRRLIAEPTLGRDAVMKAYFTGDISADLFQRWQRLVDSP